MKLSSLIKTTNLRQTSVTNQKRIWALVGLFLILLLVGWWWPSIPGQVASTFFSPLFKGETKVRDLLLKDTETETTEDTLDRLQYLEKENEELRALLSDQEDPGIVASVIGRPNTLPYDVLIVDKGSNDGVQVNTPVYIAKDQAIGVVARVYKEHSIVALVSTPGWSSTAYIYGPNIYTIITGLGGGLARVHVPQGIELKPDELVVLPALGGGLYGKITYVDSVPSRPEQYGYVTVGTTLNSLHLVTIGKKVLEKQDFAAAKEVVERLRKDLLTVPVPEEVLVDVEGLASSTATSTTPTTDSNN